MKLHVVDENGVAVRESYEVRLSGWTEERYFAEAPEQGFYEFKNGELIVHSAVNIEHQGIVRFLTFLLTGVVSKRSLGTLFNGPAVLRLRGDLCREPDIVFVSTAHLAGVTAQYVSGPADFVIEVVSEGGRARDLKEKAGEYEAAGVAEYWAVDPANREVVVHRRVVRTTRGPDQQGLAEGAFEVTTAARGRLESAAVPGFRIEVDWLWQRPMPGEFDCLREVVG